MRRIWRQAFTPSVFDLDARGELAPAALCRYFGIAAGCHACELGLGDEALRPQGIAWMLNRLEARFTLAATGADPFTVETWPSERTGRLRAERDFVIRRGEAVIAHGLSTWLLIQLASRKPARMFPQVLDVAVKGKAAPFEAASTPEDDNGVGEVRWQVPAAWTDLDINGHVSFPRLVEWTLNAAPPDHWTRRRLSSAILRFEQEALPGELITARFSLHGEDGFHSLEKGERSAVRAWTTWQSI